MRYLPTPLSLHYVLRIKFHDSLEIIIICLQNLILLHNNRNIYPNPLTERNVFNIINYIVEILYIFQIVIR